MEKIEYTLTLNDVNTERFKNLVRILGYKYEDIYQNLGFQSSSAFRATISQGRISLKHVIGLSNLAGNSFSLALERLEREEIANKYHLEYNPQGYMKLLNTLGNKDLQIQKLQEMILDLETKLQENKELSKKVDSKEKTKVNKNKFPFKHDETVGAKKSY